MRYHFRLRSSAAALAAMGPDKTAIVTDIVREAERLGLGAADTAIFEVPDRGLKVTVRFAQREIHVLTSAEHARAGLPDRPAQWG